jgi:hypothetical protein
MSTGRLIYLSAQEQDPWVTGSASRDDVGPSVTVLGIKWVPTSRV